MAHVLTLARCPNCGAPVNTQPGALRVICIYCDQSLTVVQEPGKPQASLKSEGLPALEVARVKEFLLDGKREEAVAHYMRVATVSQSEAEAAVDALAIESYFQFTRHLPLNAVGLVLYFVILLVVAGLAALCVFLTQYSPNFWVVLALPVALFFFRIVALVRRASATWTDAFGAKAKAKVLRCGLLREMDTDSFFVVCHFEVTPDDGSESFRDQETVYVGAETLKKLQTGNVIGVRYDRAREHVYMQAPVMVLATGS